MRPKARADNLTIFFRKKQIKFSFSRLCPVIENEFRHNIAKVVCGSTRLWPRGSTTTLTKLGKKFMINNRTDARKTNFDFY